MGEDGGKCSFDNTAHKYDNVGAVKLVRVVFLVCFIFFHQSHLEQLLINKYCCWRIISCLCPISESFSSPLPPLLFLETFKNNSQLHSYVFKIFIQKSCLLRIGFSKLGWVSVVIVVSYFYSVHSSLVLCPLLNLVYFCHVVFSFNTEYFSP